MAGEGKLPELLKRVEEMRTHHCPRPFGGQCDLCMILAAYDGLRALVGRLGEGLGPFARADDAYLKDGQVVPVVFPARAIRRARALHKEASAVAGRRNE